MVVEGWLGGGGVVQVDSHGLPPSPNPRTHIHYQTKDFLSMRSTSVVQIFYCGNPASISRFGETFQAPTTHQIVAAMAALCRDAALPVRWPMLVVAEPTRRSTRMRRHMATRCNGPPPTITTCVDSRRRSRTTLATATTAMGRRPMRSVSMFR